MQMWCRMGRTARNIHTRIPPSCNAFYTTPLDRQTGRPGVPPNVLLGILGPNIGLLRISTLPAEAWYWIPGICDWLLTSRNQVESSRETCRNITCYPEVADDGADSPHQLGRSDGIKLSHRNENGTRHIVSTVTLVTLLKWLDRKRQPCNIWN